MFVQLSSSGLKMPMTGFGTWRLRGPELEPAIREAVKIGYRHFDGAAIYENESELGPVFESIINKERLVSRSEVTAFNINISAYFILIFVSYSLLQNYGSLK